MSYTHSDVAHNWAHQLKERQNATNMSFEGSKLYSYQTVIGQRVTINQQVIYLLNSSYYSSSTSKHQGYMNDALPVDAIKFSISPRGFRYKWGGYFGGEMSKNDQINLAKEYIEALYIRLKQFTDSKTIATEDQVSLYWYKEAERWCKITGCITIKQLVHAWKNQIYSFGEINYTQLRCMLKALNNGVHNIKFLVDITFGDGTYQAYVSRTKTARSGRYTKRINFMLGFNTHEWDPYYCPYRTLLDRGVTIRKNLTFLEDRTSGYVEGGLSKSELDKWHKQGCFIQKIHEIKSRNLLSNLQTIESISKHKRVAAAKERLETYIGMRGWRKSWMISGFMSFDYNGVVYEFYGDERYCELSDAEYAAFAKMDEHQKDLFIYEKRQYVLELLQAHKAEKIRRQKEINERYRIAEAKRIEREAKRDYIEAKKREGDIGLVELYHEGLVDGYFSGKGASFFHGGNALLRYNKDLQIVETSKGIKVPIAECKRLWPIIDRWHKNNTTFTSSDECVYATTNNWKVQRFQDDIMIAGCHAIHYSEMHFIAQELGLVA